MMNAKSRTMKQAELSFEQLNENTIPVSASGAKSNQPRYQVIHNRSGRTFIEAHTIEEIRLHLFEGNADCYTLLDRKHDEFCNAQVIFNKNHNQTKNQ